MKLLKYLAGTALACLSITGPNVMAQSTYPAQPVRIVVPWPPGGSADPFARLMASELDKKWGKPVVVENKPGANAMIGTAQVARAQPDGYTLLAALGNHTMNPAMYRSMQFDTGTAFQPIALMALAPNILVVRNNFPAKDFETFIAELKKNPGKYSYASSGKGGTPHVAGALFEKQAGVKLLHVPYKGAGPAMTDLLSGTVDMSFATLSSALPHIHAGKIRALAITHDARVPQLPDLPTLDELGVADVHVSTWYGFMGPAGMPKDVVRKIESDLKEISEQKAVQDNLRDSLGSVKIFEDSEKFDKRIQDELVHWKDVVKQTGITMD